MLHGVCLSTQGSDITALHDQLNLGGLQPSGTDRSRLELPKEGLPAESGK
jgi:hypothetical protein